MNDTDLHRVASRVIARSLDGGSETDLLNEFCVRARDVGVDISRAMAIVDTLHPVYEGRAFRWRSDGVEETSVIEYGPTSDMFTRPKLKETESYMTGRFG